MNLMLLGEEALSLELRQREMLSAALAASEELGSTIDELLDVTRIESDQLRLNLAPVDLVGLLRQVRSKLQPRFDDARVMLQISAEIEPAIARGDSARLGTVFTNILVNALKYSPPQGIVTVLIAAESGAAHAVDSSTIVSAQNAGAPPRVMLRVAVTDTGPGVPVEYREKVFEKFFRVEHQRGDSEGGVRGTGIGLYLCREIVRAHGGTIWCEPGDGGIGTRVAFTIPRAD
jgi:NtrC-family two-component system sensor histidine kinase KinB